MARAFKFIILLLGAGATSAAVTIFYHTALTSAARPTVDIEYSDFLSITLTALALMITILGFFVAAASVIGWTTIENKLRDHSVQYFKGQLGKDGELRSELEQLFTEIAYKGVIGLKTESELPVEDKVTGAEGPYSD